MRTPKTIAGWCTVLFFLLYGLVLVGVGIPSGELISGILAPGATTFTLIGR